jgi:hypothetical protein
MMKVIEMDRLEWEAKKKVEEKQPEDAAVQEAPASEKRYSKPTVQDENDSDSYEEVEVTDSEGEGDDAQASKRPRVLDPDSSAPQGPVDFDEDDIEWQLAQMGTYSDAEDMDNDAEDSDPGLPMTEDDNIALFRSLLDDFHISPYTAFEKLIDEHALIDDRRYTALPNMQRRREVFVDWSRDRVAEINSLKAAAEENKSRQDAARNDSKTRYLSFLQKYATPKLYWPEFKRKHRKEDQMKDYEVSDKDREKLYREYIQKIKGSEADRRKELLALLKGLDQESLNRKSTVADVPSSALKDLRWYLVDEKKRNEVVEGYFSTLGDV